MHVLTYNAASKVPPQIILSLRSHIFVHFQRANFPRILIACTHLLYTSQRDPDVPMGRSHVLVVNRNGPVSLGIARNRQVYRK
mgnify:CR=1 FL=1